MNFDYKTFKNESQLYNYLVNLSDEDKVDIIKTAVNEKFYQMYSFRTLEVIAFVCMKLVTDEELELEYYKQMVIADKGDIPEDEIIKQAKDIQDLDLYTGSQWDNLEDYLEDIKQCCDPSFIMEVRYWNDHEGTGLPRRTSGKIRL